MCVASVGVKRSITFNASLWKFPAWSNQVWSPRLTVSITSVSPSHLPRPSPVQKDSARGVRELVRHADVFGRLGDFEREGQVRGARHSGHEAAPERIGYQ